MMRNILDKVIQRIKIFKLNKKAKLGKNVQIQKFTITSPENLFVGDNVYIGPDSYLNAIGGIEIKSGTIIGPFIKILTSNHNYCSLDLRAIPYDGRNILKKVVIEENVWIGMDVKICPGVTIGEGSIVAMGSVVTKDIPPFSIVGGNPAKVIKYRDKEQYSKLKKEKKIYLKLKKEGIEKIDYLKYQ